MGNKINLVRPDGSLISATPAEAENLKLLGYKEESVSEANARAIEAANEEYYSSTNQQIQTAIEAGGRGLTLGATDYLFGDEESAARRQYNPGLSTGFEIAGALAPLVLSGGTAAPAEAGTLASVARLAPTSLISRGARAAVGAGEGTGALRSVMAGALEGGIMGGAAEVNRAYLDGDPITAESVLHGIGWGAVYGGGFTALGEGLIGAGNRLTGRLERKAAGDLGAAAEDAWRAESAAANYKVDLFRSGLDTDAVRAANARGAKAAASRREAWEREVEAVMEENAAKEASHARATSFIEELNAKRASAKKAAEEAATESARLADPIAPTRDAYSAFHREVQNSTKALESTQAAADRAIKGVFEELKRVPEEELIKGTTRRDIGLIKRGYTNVQRAMDSGNPTQIQNAINSFADRLDNFNEYLGVHYKPIQALEELAQTRAVTKQLAGFPSTADEFIAMSPKQADRLFAALEGARSLRAYPELGKAVEDAAGAFGASAGLVTKGTSDLRKTWEALRGVSKAEAKPISFGNLEPIKGGGKPRLESLPEEPAGYTPKREPRVRQGYREPSPKTAAPEPEPKTSPFGAFGDAGYWAVRAAGGPQTAAAWAAAKTVMAKLRGQTVARLESAAAKYAPKAGKTLRTVGPSIDPLKTRLDGTYEAADKPREQLAADRAREFMAAYPTINDTMYKAVEPLIAHEPALAPALHKAGVDAFNGILADLPRDPGSVSALKSIWQPSTLQAETLARRLAVFHDPVGEAETMLETGSFDPIKVKTLKVVAPAVWQKLRIDVLGRLEDPAVLDKLSYQDQIGLGTMLDINMHSSMRPEQIATSQQIFLRRKEPLPTPTPAGSQTQNPGGRPAANSPSATQGQKVTDH